MIDQITEDDFNKAAHVFRVIVHDNPRKFGAVRLPHVSQPFLLCWRSDLVEPTIVPDRQASAIWIGVDQRIVCLTLQGEIRFSIGLDSNFLQLLPFPQCTVILTETHAIGINSDFSVRRIVSLREIPEVVEVEGDKLTVKFIDGETETLSL